VAKTKKKKEREKTRSAGREEERICARFRRRTNKNDDEPKPLDSHSIPNLAPLSETLAIARVSFTAATRATTERNDDDDDDDNFFVELLFGGHQRVCNGARIYVSDFETIRAMFATTDGNTREKRGGKESGD
jgi:hypothetical protein